MLLICTLTEHGRREISWKRALSCETSEDDIDLGMCPEFSQFCAFLKWFPLSGIPSPLRNIPPVLQGPTYVAPYPCDGSLPILSEWAATLLCSPTPAHNVFIINSCVIIVW